jgi:hypothetical protein
VGLLDKIAPATNVALMARLKNCAVFM